MRFARPAIRLVLIAAALAVIAASVPYAYLQMFSQFQIYDDEGWIMESVRTFLDGHALFDRTFSQYGPFYYLVAGLFYRVTGLAVGHDVTRIATIGLWLLAAALVAVFVYAATRALALALFAYLQAVLYCTGLIGEPGHPQGLLLVLIALLLVAGSALPVSAVPIALGIVAGCVMMTKINLGVFAAGACVVTLLAASRYRMLRAAAGVGFSVLPLLLMRASLSGPTLVYALASACGIAACCIASVRLTSDRDAGLRPAVRFTAAMAATALVIVACTLATGTSIAGLIQGVVVAPTRLAGVYGQVWALPATMAWYGGASLAMAIAVVILPSASLRRHIGIALKLAFALLMLRAAMGGPVPMATLAPFVWVVMLPVEAAPAGRASFVRGLVALVAASQLLAAYPVAGNQQAWATLWLVPAALVAAADGVAALWPMPGIWIPRLADAVLVGGVLFWFAPSYQTAAAAERYRIFASLDLPGAERIRLPRAEKRTYHAVVDAVRANCDTLMTMPGLNSFHFWTRIPPPTGLNVGTWMTLLDAPAQQRIVDALEGHASACVIYHDGLFRGWVGAHDVEGAPLVKHIRSSFHAVRTIGDYQLLIRNGRQLPE